MGDFGERLGWRLFDAAFRPWMSRRVGDVHLVGLPPELPRDEPVLICPNHPSWWDGFLVRALQRRLRPRAAFRTLVLESEVRRHPFLTRLGAVPIRPDSIGSVRDAGRTLASLRERDPGAVVCVFPQGRIVPSHRRPLGFQPGLRLFRKVLRPCWILPVALHLEYLDRPAAHAFVAAGPPLPPGRHADGVVAEVEHRVEAELDALMAFLGRHGEAAPRRWPGPGGRLPRVPAPRRWARDRAWRLSPWLSTN